jgi:hypothetical protein
VTLLAVHVELFANYQTRPLLIHHLNQILFVPNANNIGLVFFCNLSHCQLSTRKETTNNQRSSYAHLNIHFHRTSEEQSWPIAVGDNSSRPRVQKKSAYRTTPAHIRGKDLLSSSHHRVERIDPYALDRIRLRR